MAPLVIGNLSLPHRLVLAPMCGITLKPFRQICKEYGAGLVFNQMISAKALVMGDVKSRRLMEFDESERPVGLQLFGNDAATLAESARVAEDAGPDAIDLNLGCPARKIVNDGGGSALLSDLERLAAILKAMRKAIRGVFTVKMRAGGDHADRNAVAVARLAEAEGADAVALHARTRAQGYSGRSDWGLIAEVKRSVAIPVIGNGDVTSATDARRMITETACDAVMTGRAAFAAPWIFRDFVSGHDTTPEPAERLELIRRQYAYATEFHGKATAVKMMRKHLCAYTKGFADGAEFRDRVLRLEDAEAVLNATSLYFLSQRPPACPV